MDDEFAVDNEIVVRFFQVHGKHFCHTDCVEKAARQLSEEKHCIPFPSRVRSRYLLTGMLTTPKNP